MCGWPFGLMRCSEFRRRRRLSKAGGSALLMRCSCPTAFIGTSLYLPIPFICNSLYLQFPSFVIASIGNSLHFAMPFVCTVWHSNFPTAAVSASTKQCIKATYCQGKHAIGPAPFVTQRQGRHCLISNCYVQSMQV